MRCFFTFHMWLQSSSKGFKRVWHTVAECNLQCIGSSKVSHLSWSTQPLCWYICVHPSYVHPGFVPTTSKVAVHVQRTLSTLGPYSLLNLVPCTCHWTFLVQSKMIQYFQIMWYCLPILSPWSFWYLHCVSQGVFIPIPIFIPMICNEMYFSCLISGK